MGRPKKNEIKNEKQTNSFIQKQVNQIESIVSEVKTDASEQKNFVQEMEEQRAIANQLNTEKANKDMLLKTAKELENHISNAKKELSNIGHELDGRYKTIKYIDEEIKARNFQLERLSDSFEQKNKERLRLIEEKEKDIFKANEEYKKLLREVKEKSDKLSSEIYKISEERRFFESEMNRMNIHCNQVNSEMAKLKEDIENREAVLKEKEDILEAEKQSFEPELKRISQLKNENNMLLDKIEQDRKQFIRQQDSFEAYKKKIDSEDEIRKNQYRNQELSIQAKEAKIRKWEQDLKDIELELKAREADVQKQIKRYQLQESIKKGE